MQVFYSTKGVLFVFQHQSLLYHMVSYHLGAATAISVFTGKKITFLYVVSEVLYVLKK